MSLPRTAKCEVKTKKKLYFNQKLNPLYLWHCNNEISKSKIFALKSQTFNLERLPFLEIKDQLTLWPRKMQQYKIWEPQMTRS